MPLKAFTKGQESDKVTDPSSFGSSRRNSNSMNIKWLLSTPEVLEITRLLVYDSPEVERAYENMMIIK